ncbi:MAG: flagellar basal body P-ring formation chaperone FlgA [Fibromonadaceae bacterium]|jgi:flagella basal body P-ring formation protein FlgA|nr:flagellar basal body P-ring formation chaperone FlgA [Fibromonadaceae bacterium]
MGYGVILAFFVVGIQAIFASQVTIVLKSQAEVEPGVIRLEQIADIKGDKDIVNRVSNLEVGKVAAPGRKTRITENALKGFFIKSVTNRENVVFSGAKFCDVTARSKLLTADSLKKLLLNEVRSQMPANLQEDKDWKFSAPKAPNNLATPERGGKILVNLSPQFKGIGQEMATVQIFDGNRVISKHNVPFVIHRFEHVAELKKNVHRGEMISEQDFKMVWQETTFQKRKVIKKPEEAIGRTAIRTLRSNELLVDNALTTPYAIREGDVVKLFAKFGESVVQINAIAQKNAFEGQTISLRNMDTGKGILATVSGQGEAWINP